MKNKRLMMGSLTVAFLVVFSVFVFQMINAQGLEESYDPFVDEKQEVEETDLKKFADYQMFDDRIEMDVVKQDDAERNFKRKLQAAKEKIMTEAEVEQENWKDEKPESATELEMTARTETPVNDEKQNNPPPKRSDKQSEQQKDEPRKETKKEENKAKDTQQKESNSEENKQKEQKKEENKQQEKPKETKKEESKPKTASSTDPGLEKKVVELVNKERANHGLGKVSQSSDLVNLARLKAADMHQNNYFSHHSPTYGSPFDLLDDHGIAYWYAGENIAKGYRSAEEVFDAWMNSPSHREVILKSEFTHIGVGYVEGHWVQLFIQR